MTATTECRVELLDSPMNSLALPQIKPVQAVATFGLKMLSMLPSVLSSTDPALITTALEELCRVLTSFEDEELFSTWSPRLKAPMKQLSMTSNETSASASEQTVSRSWSGNGGVVDIKFDKPSTVSFVKVSWIPPMSNNRNATEMLGAPQSLTIFVKASGSETFESVWIGSPEAEKERQGSWSQYLLIDRQNVEEIKILVSQQLSKFSSLKKSCIYELTAFDSSKTVQVLHTMDLLQNIQSSLSKLTVFPGHVDSVLMSGLGLLRASASLSFSLRFLWSSSMPGFSIRDLSPQVKRALCDLLHAIRANETKATVEFNQKYAAVIQGVEGTKFEDRYLTDACKLQDSGKVLEVSSGSCCGVIARTPTESTVYEWELLLNDVVEKVSIGLVVIPAKYEIGTISTHAWLYMCESGELIANGEKSDRHAVSANSGDLIKIVHSQGTGLVSLSINGVYHGVIFEQVSSHALPIVLFGDSTIPRTVSLVSFRLTPMTAQKTIAALSLPNEFVETDLLDDLTLTDIIFQYQARLAVSQSNIMALKDSSSSTEAEKSQLRLDYPFCAEISLDTFKQLSNILNTEGQTNDRTLHAIQILEWQLHILKSTGLALHTLDAPPIVLANPTLCTEAEQRVNDCMLSIKSFLLASLTNKNELIRQTVVKAFCRGINTFLPTIIEKVQMVVRMMSSLQDEIGHSQDYLLITVNIIEGLCNVKVVQDMLKMCELNASEVQSFYLMLLDQLFTYELDFVDGNGLDNDSSKRSILTIGKQLFSRFVEEILYQRSNGAMVWAEDLLMNLITGCMTKGIWFIKALTSNQAIADNQKDGYLKDSLIGKVLQPTLHAFVSSKWSMDVTEKVGACIIELVGELTLFNNSLNTAKVAMNQLSLFVDPLCSKSGSSIGSGGWKVLKTTFEDADSSFSVTDNGLTYTSLHSTNTCALANVSFGPGQKAAWEFQLETDSQADECSVFGAARKPLTSRCYSSSSDLWMRRSYNGYMYAQGTTTGQSMEKIHPGDIVRIEFDGDKGTLMFSLNGSEPELGFSDIHDEIYPACGSYRNGVVIKLLKVEVYQSMGVEDNADDQFELRPTGDISWVTNVPTAVVQSSGDSALFVHPLSREKSKVLKTAKKWTTARGNRGACQGIHRWAFEFEELPDGPYSIGFSSKNVAMNTKLASTESADATGFALAWNSDGSVWYNGRKVMDDYGLGFMPLKKKSVVTMTIDFEQSVIYFDINGQRVEGNRRLKPESLKLPSFRSQFMFLFPAASLSKSGSKVRIRAAGLNGSTVLPFGVDLKIAASCILGQLTSVMMMHPSPTEKEVQLLPWLQSPIMLGGISDDVYDSKRLAMLDENDFDAILTEMSKLRESYAAVDALDVFDPKDLIWKMVYSGKVEGKLDSEVQSIYEWFETLDPEQATLRKLLERSKSYRFPVCELPFVACLIKHSGCQDELARVSQALSDSSPVECSAELFLAWQKTKQLRSFLRMQRQKLMTAAADAIPLVVELLEAPLEKVDEHEKLHGELFEPVPVIKAESDAESSLPVHTSDGIIVPVDAPLFHFGFTVEWKAVIAQKLLKVTNVNTTVTFTRWCFDQSKSRLLIEIDARTDNRSLDVSTASLQKVSATLNDTITLASPIFLAAEKASNKVKGLLIFEANQESPFVVSKVELSVVGDEAGSKCSLYDVTTAKVGQVSSTRTFEEQCIKLRRKAQFLFLVSPVGQQAHLDTRSALLGLSSRYSGSVSVLANKADLSRWRTQERWRKVVEFLHVHSKVKRQLSREYSQDASSGPFSNGRGKVALSSSNGSALPGEEEQSRSYESTVSNSQAIIQACGVFITSDEILWDSEILKSILLSRMQRARYRATALKLLSKQFSIIDGPSDPFSVHAVLSFVKDSLPPTSMQLEKASRSSRPGVHHYLTSLEGCSASALKEVQDAFSDLYSAFASCLSSMLKTWESDKSNSRSPVLMFPIINILRMWIMNYSGRDVVWIQSSGILPLLQKLTSFQLHEKICQAWKESSMQAVQIALHLPDCDKSMHMKLWPQAFVEKALLDGTLAGRELLVHSILIAKFCLSDKELSSVPLNDWVAHSIQPVVDIKFAQMTYFEVLFAFSKRSEDIEAKSKKVEGATEAAPIASSGRSCFDPQQCAGDITLTEANDVATIVSNGSSVAAMVFTNVAYTSESIDSTGNYFEVAILRAGAGDIGIGFASADIAVVGNMPGWPDHSYGLHGDDGETHGAHRAFLDVWPRFENGDTIGCGINFADHTIFYTRNGEILGVGFSGFDEASLVAAVGFSNQNSQIASVRINFGAQDFVYRGPEVIINAQAVQERSRLQKETEALTAIITGPAESVRSEESSRSHSVHNVFKSYREHELQVSEFHLLKNLSAQLTQFFLLSFCKVSEESLIVPVVTSASIPDKLALLKDILTFGSSNEENKADAQQLRSSVLSVICHELTVGVQYLKQLESKPKSLQMLDDEHLNTEANGDDKHYPEVVLERQEIDIALQALLTPITCLLACSRNVSDDICRSKALSVLFQLLGSSLLKCSQLAVSILRSIIPAIEPSRVEEAVTADMIALVDVALDEENVVGEAKRKVRKFPDYFVRYLINQAAQLLYRQPNEVGRDSIGQPYGSGNLRLATGQSMIALLRKLLESPLWTEIVGHNIVFRLKAIESLLTNPVIDDLDHSVLTAFPAACAVCFCITAFPMLNSGSVVETMIGTEFHVVSTSEFSETVDAVMQTHLKEFHFTKHVESISRNCLRLKKVQAKVDFGKLSQPILSQLVMLAKQCLTLTALSQKSGDFGQHIVLSKLCSTVSWTLSSLIDSQPEFLLDLLHEADLMRDFGKLAGLPQPIQQILPFQQLQNLWSFTQQRSLEQVLLSVPVAVSLSAVASSGDKESLSEIKQTTEMEISSTARASRQASIEEFAQSCNLSIPFAMMLFEFASGDIHVAKQLLTLPSSIDPAEEANSWILQPKVDETKEQSNVSDENILKGISHSKVERDVEDSLSSSQWRILESLGEEVNVNLNRSVILSTEEGKGKIEYDKIGTLRKFVAGSTDGIVEYLDFETGLSIFRTANTNGLKRLKEWCGVSFETLSKSLVDVDMSIIIASMRLIVSKLLSGNLVSAKWIFNNDKLQALSAIKFIAGTNDRNLNGSLPGIIEGFATSTSFVSESAAAVESTDEFDLVSSLVEDSQKMLESICVVNLLRRDQDTTLPLSESDYFRLSSPHPFPAPFKSVGKIAVPASWTGGTIRFNPKCCTPSEKATLSLFFGETEYNSGIPSFCFFGSKGDKSYFQDAPVPAGTTIYYVFEAKEHSRRLEFEVKDVSGQGEIVDGFWQVKRVATIGLGEEDTLFNLFEGTSVVSGTKALIMADCVWLKSGCCHVQVIFSSKDEEDDESISSFGFVTEAFVAKEDRDTAVPQPGCIWLQSDGSVTTLSEGSVDLPPFKTWYDSDVLDAVITLADGQYSVRFAKNGVWSDRVFSADLPADGVRPCVVLSGNLRAKFRLSKDSMLYPPPEELNSSTVVKSLMEMQPENFINAWGYDFVVQPVADLDIIVTNEFELIWSSKTDETASAKPGEATKKFWVWRAVAKKSSYYPPADIVTTTSVPPARSILINRSLCKNPTSYSCVFFSSKTNFAVWRPKPPENYVSLGDVVTNGNSAASPPSTTLFICVPKWATKSCEALTKISTFKKLGEGKPITNGTIWKLNNNLGYFFGSPYSQRKSDAPRSSDFRFNGVGAGFTLLADVASLVAAEWYSEANITRQPSLNWVREVIRCLLANKKWRLSVLNESMFSSIIKYMRSSTAAAPVKMTPILIQMVRLAQKEHVSLPLQDVKSLCNVILNEALSIIQNNKKSEVPKALMSLVDLVVEIQAVHVSESSRADRHSKSRILLKEKLQREYEESKEEEFAESKEEEKTDETIVKGDSSVTLSSTQVLSAEALTLRNNWWERPALDITDVKLHRVMRKDNVENIFIKDNMLLKLKQALKFLFAVQKTDLASSEDGDVASLTFERGYPKLMTSKLWYEYVSRCAFLESRHPYREAKYKRIVSFPGVDHLTVTFDKRSSLCPGDKLTLSVPGGSSFEFTSATVESATKDIQFVSDVLIVTFEADTSKQVNEAREWGWALLIAASNQKLYESANISIDLKRELDSAIETAAAGARKSLDEETDIFVNERQRSASYNSDSDSGSVDSVPGCPLELDLVLKPPIVDFKTALEEEEVLASALEGESEGILSPRPQTKRGGKRVKGEEVSRIAKNNVYGFDSRFSFCRVSR